MEDERVIPLMRDELGMFKSEQMTLERAIKLLPILRKRKDVERKGEKVVVKNIEAFNKGKEIATAII